MALSDDQRALLRLLAQREQGYEDIAALKGMSVEDVRAEVREALAALDTPPPEPPPPPPPPSPEPAPAKAEEASPDPAPTAKPKAAPRPRAGARSRPAVPVERRRFVLIAGGALAIVAIVLGAVAIFSGGSDSSSSSGSAGEAGGSLAAAAAEEGKVTQAVLEAADGSEAGGRAIFGRVGKKEVVLQVTAEGLEPTEAGESYTVWLYRTPKLSLRIGSVPVDESGKLGARFSIPTELLAYVASGAFDQIYVSRTSNAAYQQVVARAKKEKSIPRYTGETVLTGEITGPVAKAGQE